MLAKRVLQMVNRKSWRRSVFAIGMALGVFLFARQLWSGYRALRQQEFVHFRPGYLLAALMLSLLVYILQMLAWLMIMRHLGISIGVREALRGFFLSFLPRYIPGSVWGYWSRSHWLEDSLGIGYSTSVLGSILEALALVLTALTVAGVHLTLRSSGYVRFLLALGSACVMGFTWLAVPRVSGLITQRLAAEEPPLFGRRVNGLRAWSVALGLCTILWLTYGGSVLLVGNALLPRPSGKWLASTSAAALSWTLGFVAVFVPSGLGVREASLSVLLPRYTDFVPWQANLIGVVCRFEILLAELLLLIVGLVLRINAQPDNSPRQYVEPSEEE
ncbi:MAG: lysylphosphatidylglycerol synthase domain-containing protein [Anaerolineae bacterium]|jgi:hypothetical protein